MVKSQYVVEVLPGYNEDKLDTINNMFALTDF